MRGEALSPQQAAIGALLWEGDAARSCSYAPDVVRNFPAFSYSEAWMSSLDPFVGAAPSQVSSGCFAVMHTLNGMPEI